MVNWIDLKGHEGQLSHPPVFVWGSETFQESEGIPPSGGARLAVPDNGGIQTLSHSYSVGDLVVYRKSKRSTAPGPRAKNIQPASHGEDYGYSVDKYWRVAGVAEGGQVVVVTRRGKVHHLSPDDQCLRPAQWWERLFMSGKFPSEETVAGANQTAASEIEE